jgi:hypothetical protein
MLAGRQPSFLQMFYRNGAPHSTNAAKRNIGIRSASKRIMILVEIPGYNTASAR